MSDESSLAHVQKNVLFWRGLLVIGRAERRKRYPFSRRMTRVEIEQVADAWERRLELLIP